MKNKDEIDRIILIHVFSIILIGFLLLTASIKENGITEFYFYNVFLCVYTEFLFFFCWNKNCGLVLCTCRISLIENVIYHPNSNAYK